MAPVKFLASLLLASLAAAVHDTVDLSYQRYKGRAMPNGISQWLGIRYAAPPLGKLRFEPPQDPVSGYGVKDADKHGPYCLETEDDPNNLDTSEDCLFLDVLAPTKATEHSRLPVLFYIQGGGFNSNSNPNINSSGLIKAADYDMVVVTMNYRVGPYGFLTDGEKVTANNGLRDQRKAMEWVQKHISKFGGNPDHVVLGGNSAGAASIAFHLTAQNGTDHHLFHGAIAGSPSFAGMLTVAESQYQYNHLVTRLGCANKHSLACLRSKTAKEIQEQNINIPLPLAVHPPLYQWLPSIDDDIVTDYTYRAFRQGKVVKVPTIFGDDSNGGTSFTPQNTTTLVESNLFMLDQYPTLTPDQLGDINALYPNPNKTCPNVGCYWRQVSNTYQEVRYMCPALFMTSALSKYGVAKSYHYRWNVKDPQQVAEGRGTPHTVEVKAIFAPGYKGTPDSYLPGGINAKVVPIMQAYYSSFVRTLDPNKHRYAGAAKWEEWKDAPDQRLRFDTHGVTAMENLGELRRRCDYWEGIGLDMLL